MYKHDDEGVYSDYANQDKLVFELKQSLKPEDIKQLHAKLKVLTHSGWMDWQESHVEDVAQFLRANPKERNNQTFDDAEARLLITYGAIVCAQLGGKMAHWFHDPALSCGWGDKRDTQASRGELLLQANFERWEPWPFDETPLVSPFSDELG